jgi:hypothetical protein
MTRQGEADRPDRALLMATAAITIVAVGMLVAVPTYIAFSERHVREAERRVEFLERNQGTTAELCAAKRAVQEAYLQKNDAEGFRLAKIYADVECNAAELDRLM